MSQTTFNAKFIILLIACFTSKNCICQKTELKINIYSGLFSYHGDGSTSTSWLYNSPYTSPQTFTSNPYGRKSGISYAVELQSQKIFKSNNFYGLSLALESMASKVNIDTIAEDGIILWKYDATGKTTLRNTYLNLNPFIGHRYSFDKIFFDILAGFETGFCLKSREQGFAVTIDKTHSLKVDNKRAKPQVDIRPRIQLNIFSGKLGLLVGYSTGLVNYKPRDNKKAYTSFIRIGMSYKLK